VTLPDAWIGCEAEEDSTPRSPRSPRKGTKKKDFIKAPPGRNHRATGSRGKSLGLNLVFLVLLVLNLLSSARAKSPTDG
jgi:hypothetical protein